MCSGCTIATVSNPSRSRTPRRLQRAAAAARGRGRSPSTARSARGGAAALPAAHGMSSDNGTKTCDEEDSFGIRGAAADKFERATHPPGRMDPEKNYFRRSRQRTSAARPDISKSRKSPILCTAFRRCRASKKRGAPFADRVSSSFETGGTSTTWPRPPLAAVKSKFFGFSDQACGALVLRGTAVAVNAFKRVNF